MQTTTKMTMAALGALALFGTVAVPASAGVTQEANPGIKLVVDREASLAGAPFTLWGSVRASGLPSDLPWDTHCTNNDARDFFVAVGCFKEYGDLFYVKDVNAEGRSAMIVWTDMQGYVKAACVNSRGSGTTGKCDRNIPENIDLCIWSGNIEMGSGPGQYNYYVAGRSRDCFNNNN